MYFIISGYMQPLHVFLNLAQFPHLFIHLSICIHHHAVL